MNKMMEKMMSGMVKPEDMPRMMNAMMEKMFSGMSLEERKEFLATMMPKCLNMMFAELNSDSKEKLARDTTLGSNRTPEITASTESNGLWRKRAGVETKRWANSD